MSRGQVIDSQSSMNLSLTAKTQLGLELAADLQITVVLESVSVMDIPFARPESCLNITH